jgi:hypothetical protein
MSLSDLICFNIFVSTTGHLIDFCITCGRYFSSDELIRYESDQNESCKTTAGDGDLKDRVRCCNQTKIADLQSNDNITFKLKIDGNQDQE